MSASRQSSHTIITRLPTRNSTLPTHASAASAATRWISLMSLLSRDDDVAKPGARVEARRQPLQVRVERQAHVEQDLRRHARVAQAARHVEDEAEHAERGEPVDDAPQRVEIAADQRVIDEVFREIRNDQRRRRADQADREDEDQPPPVRERERRRPDGPWCLRCLQVPRCRYLRGRMNSVVV